MTTAPPVDRHRSPSSTSGSPAGSTSRLYQSIRPWAYWSATITFSADPAGAESANRYSSRRPSQASLAAVGRLDDKPLEPGDEPLGEGVDGQSCRRPPPSAVPRVMAGVGEEVVVQLPPSIALPATPTIVCHTVACAVRTRPS